MLPGLFESRWWDQGIGQERAQSLYKQFVQAVPLKSAATADSISETVLWLLEGADHITGETLMIDSGMHLLGFQPK